MPTTDKKTASRSASTNTTDSSNKPVKQRHRRTMAELLQDPKYRASKGLAPLDGDKTVTEEEPAAGLAAKAPSADPCDPADAAEPALAPHDETATHKTYKLERRVPSKSGKPVSGIKKIFPSAWNFDVWDTRTEECVGSYQVSQDAITEDEAFQYVKKFCNRNMALVAGRNVVLYEVRREFRVDVTQIDTVE